MNPLKKIGAIRNVGFKKYRELQRGIDEGLALENMRICREVVDELRRAIKEKSFDKKQLKFWAQIKKLVKKTEVEAEFLPVYNNINQSRLSQVDWPWIQKVLTPWFQDGLDKFTKDYVKEV